MSFIARRCHGNTMQLPRPLSFNSVSGLFIERRLSSIKRPIERKLRETRIPATAGSLPLNPLPAGGRAVDRLIDVAPLFSRRSP